MFFFLVELIHSSLYHTVDIFGKYVRFQTNGQNFAQIICWGESVGLSIINHCHVTLVNICCQNSSVAKLCLMSQTQQQLLKFIYWPEKSKMMKQSYSSPVPVTGSQDRRKHFLKIILWLSVGDGPEKQTLKKMCKKNFNHSSFCLKILIKICFVEW